MKPGMNRRGAESAENAKKKNQPRRHEEHKGKRRENRFLFFG